MLTHLYIKNYALIKELELNPHQSLNVITGETGAGKSIMLGAIGLLLGNRADLKALFNTKEKCVIEGKFLVWAYHLQSLFEELELDYEDETSIRREISPSGKSRAFINDTPVTLEVLKQVGNRLLDIHSQHDNLLLGEHTFQLTVMDAFAENKALVQEYRQNFTDYKSKKRAYEQQKQAQAQLQKEHDYHTFLLEELQKANFQLGEQEKLENESKLLEHAEEVKSRLHQASEGLTYTDTAINDQLRIFVNALAQISDYSSEYAQLHERLESCYLELQDISQEIERASEKVEFNPEKIEEVQNRLSLLYNLFKKHQVEDLEDLLKVQQDLEEKVNKVLNFDEEIAALEAACFHAEQLAKETAQKLSESRKQVILPIQQEMQRLLSDLGMPHASYEISCQSTELGEDGADLVNFLFSANKGIAPQEISRVASGGEFSRLMLCIKYILAGKTALPTIIFDEIDTGISGEIALKMAKMFQTMTQKHQVIAISHLHQIAAKGNHHYFVYKDNSQERTFSRIKQLSQDERIQEIAQMISGAQPSESALNSARELLEN